MPYSQIEGGFGVRAVMENSIYGETYISTLIADKESFDKLIYINKRMHSVYRERGDIESANMKIKEFLKEVDTISENANYNGRRLLAKEDGQDNDGNSTGPDAPDINFRFMGCVGF